MDDFVPAEPKPEVDLPKKNFWKRFSLRQRISLIGLGILFIGLPVVVGAVKIQQELRSKASSPPPPASIPVIKTEVLPAAMVKTAYQTQVEGFDPIGPGTALSLTISNLPAGLSQGPCSVVSATPTPTPTPTSTGCTINARILVSADGTSFSDASGTTITLPQGTTRLYFKGVDAATGSVSAKVTARMVWKGDAYKGASFANQVGQESIPGPDGYPTRFEAYENTGDPQMYLGEACVNRGGVTVSTISPTPTPTKTPTPAPPVPANCSKYGAKNCPAPCQLGSSCPLCKDLVCKAPGKLTPTPTLPSGCYYQQVKCVQEPCDPVLVCPTPTPTPTPTQPATITCIISGTPTTAGTYSVGAVLNNDKTGLVGRKTLSLTVTGPTTPTPTPINAVTWSTQWASFSARDYTIQVSDGTTNGRIFKVNPSKPCNKTTGEMVCVSSNPPNLNSQGLHYMTLEVTWFEYDIEMRMFIYLYSDGKRWWSNEIRVYNGQPYPNSDWVYFNGKFFDTPVGQAFTQSEQFRLSAPDSKTNNAPVTLSFSNVKFAAFLNYFKQTPTPSVTPTPCLNPPSCPPPPAGCTYKGMSCSSCGTLECNVTPTPTPPPYIQVLTPNGGEQLTVGQSYAIQWQSSPGIANYLIYLVNSLGQESLINGVSAPNTSYAWKVDSAIMQNTRSHKIKIVDAAQGGVGLATQDLSDNFFTINSPITTPTPTVSPTPLPTTTSTPTPTVSPTTTPIPTVVTSTPTPTTRVTPTPTPRYWWYRFIPRFSVPSYLRFLFRPTPTPTRTPPMGIQ